MESKSDWCEDMMTTQESMEADNMEDQRGSERERGREGG